jgi:hypothetical protein
MEAMFRHLIGKGDAPAFPTTITDLQLLCDCDHIAAAAAAAYRNPGNAMRLNFCLAAPDLLQLRYRGISIDTATG